MTEEDFARLEGKIDVILDHIAKADATIDAVASEAMPALKSLMESPTFRMIAGIRKDK